jgi:tetratricopeptide (TPR) repeat protein
LFKQRSDSADLTRRVEQLQVAALQCTIPGEAAAPFNRAGDLLLAAGDVPGAIELYGRAIDAFIEADRFEAGIALCRKIIRTVPAVVRARCTLTWLAIGAGYTAEAIRSATEYVAYAEYRGRERHARQQLREMSAVADEHALRVALAECLIQLGDDEVANAVLGEVYSEQNSGRMRVRDAAEAWQRVRTAALQSLSARPPA